MMDISYKYRQASKVNSYQMKATEFHIIQTGTIFFSINMKIMHFMLMTQLLIKKPALE